MGRAATWTDTQELLALIAEEIDSLIRLTYSGFSRGKKAPGRALKVPRPKRETTEGRKAVSSKRTLRRFFGGSMKYVPKDGAE
jgi:hypothetical protein